MRLSRRAFLGGGVVAALSGGARGEGLRMEAGELAAGRFGYNGASPGPVLRGRVGEALKLRLVNRLTLPTSLSLPGDPAGFAGLTAVEPGEERDVVFTPNAAGFGIYGPYGPQAAAGEYGAGLFGAFVVDEPAPPAVDLDAIVVFSSADAAPLKLTSAPGGRVRLRLANAAPDQTLALRLSGAAAAIVAIDGRPCEPFAPRGGEFAMCPSARFELMFDLDGPFELALRGDKERPALSIAPAGARAAARPAFTGLPESPGLPKEIALERARQIRVAIAGAAGKGFALNGVGGGEWPQKPLFKVVRGTPVTLKLVNQTSEAQTLRLEGHAARLLHALDDGWDPYWRDALWIAPGRTLHAAFVAAAPGKWPLASAAPQKRAEGLAGWFWVT